MRPTGVPSLAWLMLASPSPRSPTAPLPCKQLRSTTRRYRQPDRYRRSAALFHTARSIISGSVNSTARATCAGWDPHPLFISHDAGSRVIDVDGNECIDYLLGLGPTLPGYRSPAVPHTVVDQIKRCGTFFALPAAAETILAENIRAAVPSLERVRLCNTGT